MMGPSILLKSNSSTFWASFAMSSDFTRTAPVASTGGKFWESAMVSGRIGQKLQAVDENRSRFRMAGTRRFLLVQVSAGQLFLGVAVEVVSNRWHASLQIFVVGLKALSHRFDAGVSQQMVDVRTLSTYEDYYCPATVDVDFGAETSSCIVLATILGRDRRIGHVTYDLLGCCPYLVK